MCVDSTSVYSNDHDPGRGSPDLLVQVEIQIVLEKCQITLGVEPVPPLPDLQLELLFSQLQPTVLETDWTVVCVIAPGDVSIPGLRQIGRHPHHRLFVALAVERVDYVQHSFQDVIQRPPDRNFFHKFLSVTFFQKSQLLFTEFKFRVDVADYIAIFYSGNHDWTVFCWQILW